MNPELIDRIQIWLSTKSVAEGMELPASRLYKGRDVRGRGITKEFLKTDISVEDADCLETPCGETTPNKRWTLKSRHP